VPVWLEGHARRRAAFGAGHLGGGQKTFAAVFDAYEDATIGTATRHINQSLLSIKFLLAY